MRRALIILFVLCGIGAVTITGYWFLKETGDTPQTVEPDTLSGKTSFEKGEYYFNHDEDPGGAYDLLKAKEWYVKATTEEKENPLVWYQLGRIYFIEGDFDAAIAAFETQSTTFGNAVPNVDYMLGLTYGYKARNGSNQEDWVRAEEAFLRFLERAPSSPYPRVDLAWVYFSQGKFTEMLTPLEEGLVYAPENPWLLNMYGLALLNADRTEEALTHFYKAREKAALLTIEDWGRTYPGNDPAIWEEGLQEFKALIDKNITLAEAR